MKIPKKFKILGQTIDVIFETQELIKHDLVGRAVYRKNQIQLRPSTESDPLTDEQIAFTFYHEFIHYILYFAEAAYSGKSEYMHQDEGFVDLVAGLLHQAFGTMDYGEKHDS